MQFRTAQNARIWLFLKTTTCFICFARCWCSHLYSLFLTPTSWRGCNYALSSLPFSRQIPSSSSLPSQFLPFCRCNNETASAATALRTINFHKCTQLQDILIAFLSVCVQATPLITLLKQDGSQSCTRYKELHSNCRPWF